MKQTLTEEGLVRKRERQTDRQTDRQDKQRYLLKDREKREKKDTKRKVRSTY